MALTKVSYSMINGATFNVLDYGVTGNGSTDDTDAIQALLRTASGNGAVFFPAGTYMVRTNEVLAGNVLQRGIQIPSNSELILDNDAIIQAITNTDDVYNILSIFRTSNVTIRGGTINGDLASHAGSLTKNGVGLRIQHGTNVTVYDTVFSNTITDGVSILYDYQSLSRPNSENVFLYNVSAIDNYRNGVSVIGLDNGGIFGGKFTGSNLGGIDIEPNGVTAITLTPSEVKNFTVSGVIASNNNSGIVVYANGTSPDQGIINGVSLTDNNLENNVTSDIYVFQADDVIISNNKTNGGASIGAICIDSSKKIIVANNDVRNSSSFGIRVLTVTSSRLVDGVTISGNVIDSSAGAGLYVDGTFSPFNNIVITDNIITKNGNDGMSLNKMDRGIISNNVVYDNSQNTDNSKDNILLQSCSNSQISNNNLYRGAGAKQTRYGINILSLSTDNLVIDNILYESGKTSSISDAGTRTTVSRNLIGQSELNGSFTLTANVSNVRVNTNILASSIVTLTPANASAGALDVYISALTSGASFTVTTSSGSAAAGTEIFYYSIS